MCIACVSEVYQMVSDGLRVNEAARVTGISRNTLYRYMRSGKLSYT
ncbi:helix-turn-helix domain-containing protein, partial [Vibrio splendidus]